MITPELEPPQPEISSNAAAANDPQQTRVHLHETSKNSFLRQSPFCPLFTITVELFPQLCHLASLFSIDIDTKY